MLRKNKVGFEYYNVDLRWNVDRKTLIIIDCMTVERLYCRCYRQMNKKLNKLFILKLYLEHINIYYNNTIIE
jgi:hypothetical protein